MAQLPTNSLKTAFGVQNRAADLGFLPPKLRINQEKGYKLASA